MVRRAWLAALCPDKKFRDGKKGVELATRACELTGWNDGQILGILSSACYETRDYDAAAKWRAKANDLTPGIMNKVMGKTMVFLMKRLTATESEAH